MSLFDLKLLENDLHAKEQIELKDKVIELQRAERFHYVRQSHATEALFDYQIKEYFGDPDRGTIGRFEQLKTDYENTKSHLLKRELTYIADNLIPYMLIKNREESAKYEEGRKPENIRQVGEDLAKQLKGIRGIQETLRKLGISSTSSYIH